ncbi:hypothetical protein BDV18DRAFT_165291 [Aspergillus unguis]
MATVEHWDIDLWSTDPLHHVDFFSKPHDDYFQHSITTGSEVETQIPASPSQVQILLSDSLQWCKISLILPRSPLPTLDKIQWTWKALASHHPCLRAVFCIDAKSGNIHQQVRVHASEVEWKEDPSWTPQSSVPSTPGADTAISGEQARLTVHRYPLSPFHGVMLHVQRAMVDSTSLSLIKRDFALLYCGLPFPVRTPLTYYLRQHLESKNAAASREFWGRTLEIIPVSAQPTAHPPQIGSQRATISMTLDGDCAAGLARLETECGWTCRLVFEALWATVLHYHSGSRDVVFAGVRRDASFPDVDSCVGFLDQTYPVRVSVEPEETFNTLFTKLDDYHAAASPHAFIGYKEIAAMLPAPVYTAITYSPDMNGPTTAGQLMGFPMVVFITGTSPAVQITCCYSSEIPALDAQVMLQHFHQALASASRKFYLPHSRVGHIELASEQEKLSIIHDAAQSARAADHSFSTTVVHLFEEQLARAPDVDAVQFENDRAVTFAELDVQANQLARVLGPVRGEIIPVAIDRSVGLIVALWGILKAGAAYTVLDPDGSLDRNQHIVEACGAPLVLASRVYCSDLQKAQSIEDLLVKAKSVDASKIALDLQPEECCYVIYTSGSTGTPKGVVVSHGAAVAGMRYHSLNGLQRWLLFYSPTFSAAQRTMLSTLVHGGTLLLASKMRLMTSLADVINEMRVDALGITPSALSILEPEQIPRVKQITLVGEKIPQELVDVWANRVHLRNTYGLSECTQLNFSSALQAKSNPRILGRPLDTTQAYVLQPGTTELAPIGVIGELCLVGPQLASGYLNNLQQTDRVFVPNPFGTGRLYRTGDLGRILSDGSFEILGRIDFQVKINGQKVNPAEVDFALIQHEEVVSCATVALSHASGPRLLSALVLSAGSQWSAVLPSLRQHVSKTLPRYMVPSFWMPLEMLPMTGNGKTDIRHIQHMAEELGLEGLALMNGVEAMIARVWSQVLDLRKRHLILELTILLDTTPLEQAAALVDRQGTEPPSADPAPFLLLDDNARGLIPDTGVVDAYPATPLQESILAGSLQLEAQEDDHYAYQRVWDVSSLDKTQLRKSFEAVFKRSDILRTSFVPHGRGFLQFIHHRDLALPWAEPHQRLEDYLATDKKQRLPVSRPMLRVALLSDQLLVVTMHHSLFDFWSHRFLYEDVAAVYRGMTAPARPPFKRFVSHLQGLPKHENDQFWASYLSDVEPTRLNHAPVQQTSTVRQTMAIDLRKALQRHSGISPAAVLYAAWALVLSQRTGNQDVLFATTLSGRDAPVLGIDLLDGPTLALAAQRVSVRPEGSPLELARDVGQGLLQTIRHAPYGMRNALAAAQLRPDAMDTMVNILIAPDDENSAEVEQIFRPYGKRPAWQSEFTTLEVTGSQGAKVSVVLTAKMEQHHAQFILDSFCRIVQAMVEQPDQPIATVTDVMGDAERDFLLNHISNRESLYVPTPELLHAAFERHAVQCPNAVAIDWNGERQVTYAQLNEMANQLAHALLEDFQVSVGDIIPLMLDKSVNTLVALLSVMKAGAAYVPLSPDNPPDRNAFIINETQASMVLTETQYSATIGVDSIARLHLDQVSLADLPTTTPTVDISPDSLAYLIYTSGSTGMPKGVKVPHRAAAAAVVSMAEVEGRHNGEWRTLQFANYVFDASVQDFFNTLSTAGTLCLAPRDKLQSDLPGTIREMAARQAILTPTVAKLLSPDEVPMFKTLIVGGEPLTRDVIEQWLPSCEILNVYGPTETSMVVSTKAVISPDRPNNIGAPFPTVMAFILQRDGPDLVPYGAPGELCIAGPQVTDGYLARDDLTDAVFVRNETWARWLPGGEIECLGRKDNQVKIHGHRIELGEIEQAILQTGLVQNTVVIPVQVNGKAQLGAFCIFASAESAADTDIRNAKEFRQDIADLRSRLTTLTQYMIPKYLFPLGDLPKLPSRKTDRSALKARVAAMDVLQLNEYSFEGKGQQYEVIPVETEAEVALEALWAKALAIPTEHLGKKANFLSLGGDSIVAISLASLARGVGYSLSVKNILRNAVLEEMAATMERADSQANVSVRRFEVPMSLTEAVQQCGLRFNSDVYYVYPAPPGQVEFLEQGHRPEQMWVLMAARRMPIHFETNRWIQATREMTAVNDILRTSWFRVSNLEWYGVVLNETTPSVVIASCGNDEEREQFIERFWAERFEFGQPFIKYAVLIHPDHTKEVVIKMDHAVYDGTLLRIFDDHFAAICQDAPVPAHGQFRNFAFTMYQSDQRTTQEFWKATLAGKDTTPRFPACESPPRITAFSKKLIATDTEAIAQATGVTIPIIFQAAYQLWLAQTTGHQDVSFDYLLSGRNVDLGAIDPQSVNGTLANFLPVRSNVDPATTTLAEYLQETQDMFWAITEHGNMGLDAIYAAAGISRAAAGNYSLFLFQPFDPAAKQGGDADDLRWLVMAKSQVRMFQPYALVVEVAKAKDNQHLLKVMYDQRVFGKEQVAGIMDEMTSLVQTMAGYATEAQVNLQKVLQTGDSNGAAL